jgi:CheY-like chemotaxis protein
MSNANAPAPSPSVGCALVVSNDEAAIKQLNASLRQLAMSSESCCELSDALGFLDQRKFEAVVVDLELGHPARTVLEKIRLSPANRTAVLFTISSSDAETAIAFKAGSNFVLRRPLSPSAIDRSLKVAYGLIVRERRRYFRCPIEIPIAIYFPGKAAVQGKTLNVSEGGVAIATELMLKPGVQVKLKFTLPDGEIQFDSESTVCWSREGLLGFQFKSLSPRLTTELQDWLSRRLEESIPDSVSDKFRSIEYAALSPNQSADFSGKMMKFGQAVNAPVERQDWVPLYRAAVSEPDVAKRLHKIELAERSMKQRWAELTSADPIAGEEKQRLHDGLETLRSLRATDR